MYCLPEYMCGCVCDPNVSLGLGIVLYTSPTGDFNIYTREAGAGGLSIAIEGPSKAEIEFEDRKDGSCGVTYVCTEPGKVSSLLFYFLSL